MLIGGIYDHALKTRLALLRQQAVGVDDDGGDVDQLRYDTPSGKRVDEYELSVAGTAPGGAITYSSAA